MKPTKIIPEIINRFPILKRLDSVKGRRIVAAAAGCLLLIIILALMGSGHRTDTGNWAVVEQGGFTVELVESGDVEAVSQKVISAPMMWGEKPQVTELVPEGTFVKKGDFLLQFDVSDLEDTKKLREDQRVSLLADMEKLKAQQALTIYNQEQSLQLAQYSYEQAELRLEMRKFESQAKQEEARLELKQAEIDLVRVRKQLESQRIIHASEIIKLQTQINEAENRVESIIDRIAKLQLTSPEDGMVVYQQVRGERVKEGYEPRPGWPLMSIPDLSRMQVKIFINEVDRLKVKVGQRVHISLEAYPEVTLTGKIREVSRLAQLVTGDERLKGFIAYADIDGTDPKLKPGITARVRIVLETLEDVLYVPVGIVFEMEGQTVVFPEGKQKPYAVYLGPRNDGFVVIESGVKPGMKLSYTNPAEDASLLGRAEEQRRVEEVRKILHESFDVFQERGILHDYAEPAGTEAVADSTEESKIDLDKLPAGIRERLRRPGNRTDRPDGQAETGRRREER